MFLTYVQGYFLGVGVVRVSVILPSVARIGVVGMALIAAGCAALLPASGPNSIVVRAAATSSVYDSSSVPYAVVKLTPEAIDVLANYEPAGLAGIFVSHKPPPAIVFHIGDVVSITIFEAAAGGLFIPIEAGVRPGNFVTLPNESIDNDGNISVPYAGVVKADGRTNVQI